MHGKLERGGFVRLAYRLGRSAASGEVMVSEAAGPHHRLFLRRGYLAVVQAARPEPGASGHEIPDHRFLELLLERLAAIPQGDYRFDAHAPRPASPGGERPIALATWARRHLEARLDSVRARTLCTELAGVRLALAKNLAPDPATLDDTDRRIIEALGRPRRLDELEMAARTPRFRLLGFLHFLRAVGALECMGVASKQEPASPLPEEAHRRLGVTPGASEDAIRRAYRRAACAVQSQPEDASTQDPSESESRLAELTQAFRTLTR